MQEARGDRSGRGTFRKVLPHDQARREVAGWKTVSELLAVQAPAGLEPGQVKVWYAFSERGYGAGGVSCGEQAVADVVDQGSHCDSEPGLAVGRVDAVGQQAGRPAGSENVCVDQLAAVAGFSRAPQAGTPTRRTRPGSSTASNSTSTTWPVGP